MGCEPCERVFEETDGALLLLVGHERGVGEAGGVIDGDVEELPAGAALAALACAIAADAVADAIDAAEFLGVDMDQFAGPFPLVAVDLAGRVEGSELAEAEPAQRGPDGGDGPPELAGDGRAGEALAAQCRDLRLGRCGQSRRAAMRSGGAVAKARLALGGEAMAPFAHGPGRDAHRRGYLRL